MFRGSGVRVPQPFQYQGSKRMLAPEILRFIPNGISRLVEPFAGSGAISFASASKELSQHYWLNDINRPLSDLLSLIVSRPREMADFYETLWRDAGSNHVEHFYSIRKTFNRSRDPRYLLYLLARCVKGSVRYNMKGEFNQSPDKRRLGTHPNRMRSNLQQVSLLLRGRSFASPCDCQGKGSCLYGSSISRCM